MTKPKKMIRIPLSPAEQSHIMEMLGQVPHRKVVQYDWTSEPGRAFIKEVRKLQIAGVPVPWIAEVLDLSPSTLAGAVGYWERASATRGNQASRRKREPRPLRKSAPEGEA